MASQNKDIENKIAKELDKKAREKLKKEQAKKDIQLRTAIQKNNIDQVKEALKKGADINHCPFYDDNYRNIEIGGNNRTPLKLAIFSGCTLEMITLLIKEGAKVNGVSFDDWPPLQVAAQYAKPEIVKCLIDSKANVNYNHSGCGTALFRTFNLEKINIETATILLEGGMNPNLTIQSGYLHILSAITQQHYKNLDILPFVKLLLQYNAIVTEDSLEHVFNFHDIKLLQVILKAQKSAVNKQVSIYRKDTKNFVEKTILHMAIESNRSDKYQWMNWIHCILDFEPNLNLTDSDGYTALHRLQQNLDVSENNYSEIKDLILRMQTMQITQNAKWKTIHELTAKILKGDNEALEQMLKLMPKEEDSRQMVQDSIIEHLRFPVSEKYLISGYLSKEYRRTNDQQKAAVKLMIMMNADVNELSLAWEQTPLYSSSLSNDKEMVSFLLQNKADPNIATRDGTTAIRNCFFDRNPEILKMLLDSNTLDYNKLCYRDAYTCNGLITLLDGCIHNNNLQSTSESFKENKYFLKEKYFMTINKFQEELDSYCMTLAQIPHSHLLRKIGIFKQYIKEYTANWAITDNGKKLLQEMINKTNSSKLIWSRSIRHKAANVQSQAQETQASKDNIQGASKDMLNQFKQQVNQMSLDLQSLSQGNSRQNFENTSEDNLDDLEYTNFIAEQNKIMNQFNKKK